LTGLPVQHHDTDVGALIGGSGDGLVGPYLQSVE
jgi:hypothetical protein